MEEEKTKTGFLGYLTQLMDRFSGDKVIFLIALFLMLISVVSVFSSTPRLVNESHGVDRVAIMVDQLKVVALGFIIIFGLYFFGKQNWFKALSELGFVASFALLAILVLNLNLGFVRASSINGARRILSIGGFQLHVYEYIKLFMIMYLGWALDTFRKGQFKWAAKLAERFPRLQFLARDGWQKVIYIYMPILIVTLMVSAGSNSSAIFIGGIMILMVLIGGLEVKDVAMVGLVILLGFGGMFMAYKWGWLQDTRLGTLVSRITNDDEATMKILLESPRESPEWLKARAKLDQPVGAKLAIKEGGILGKGIGNSTQKYQVPVIFGDYMFSFIVEETGLWGALILIILYFSLLARGTLVAKMCDNYYDKIIVSGLIILVTGQAFMHMCVNVHMPFVPQTGQTLPLVSHGTNAFIVFSVVFGILLSISKDARDNMARKQAELQAEAANSWTQDSTV
jgi:cell division protein FtsW